MIYLYVSFLKTGEWGEKKMNTPSVIENLTGIVIATMPDISSLN